MKDDKKSLSKNRSQDNLISKLSNPSGYFSTASKECEYSVIKPQNQSPDPNKKMDEELVHLASVENRGSKIQPNYINDLNDVTYSYHSPSRYAQGSRNKINKSPSRISPQFRENLKYVERMCRNMPTSSSFTHSLNNYYNLVNIENSTSSRYPLDRGFKMQKSTYFNEVYHVYKRNNL